PPHTPHSFLLHLPPPPPSTLFPYTTLFRSVENGLRNEAVSASQHAQVVVSTVQNEFPPAQRVQQRGEVHRSERVNQFIAARKTEDRKSTRLNSSHVAISYAVFCLKKKKKKE